MYYYYIVDDNIRNRAYYLSLKYKNNTQLQNWLQAEREFMREYSGNSSSTLINSDTELCYKQYYGRYYGQFNKH